MMKRYLVTLFCSASCLANWIAIGLNAQATGKASVQSHLAAAKNAAYEPGNDLTVLYDTVCAPASAGPKEPNIQALAESRPPQSGPRSEWRTEPGKVFDNLYYVGSPFQSTWPVTTSEGRLLGLLERGAAEQALRELNRSSARTLSEGSQP